MIKVTIFISGKLYGRRMWPAVPSLGHQVAVTLEGQRRVAVVRSVVWGTDTEFELHLHCSLMAHACRRPPEHDAQMAGVQNG